jgi:hypothetical protein
VITPVKNKSKDIKEFFESVRVRNNLSTAHEQWQNWPASAESTINSIMLLTRTVMIQIGGRFWSQFRAVMAGKDYLNTI